MTLRPISSSQCHVFPGYSSPDCSSSCPVTQQSQNSHTAVTEQSHSSHRTVTEQLVSWEFADIASAEIPQALLTEHFTILTLAFIEI